MRYPCDVELITSHRRCAGTPARPFTARCNCGLEIAGHICLVCAMATYPGCLACWQDGRGHRCAAKLTVLALTGGA